MVHPAPRHPSVKMLIDSVVAAAKTGRDVRGLSEALARIAWEQGGAAAEYNHGRDIELAQRTGLNVANELVRAVDVGPHDLARAAQGQIASALDILVAAREGER